MTASREKRERGSFRVKGRKKKKEATSHSLEMSWRERVWERKEYNKRRALEKKYADMMAAQWVSERFVWQDGGCRSLSLSLSHNTILGCAAASQRMQATRELFIFPGVGVKCHLSKCRFDPRCHTCIRSIQWLSAEASRELNNSCTLHSSNYEEEGGEQGGERHSKAKGKKAQPWRTVDNSLNLIRYLYIECIIHSTIHSNNNKRI